MYKIFMLIVCAILFSCAHRERKTSLCPNLVIYSPDKIEFTDAEKRLLCGDPDEEAYKNIPAYQAKFSIQGFLQSKGYSRPEFNIEEDVLHVHTGEQTKLTSVVMSSDNKVDTVEEQNTLFRQYRKEVLTPSVLNNMEKEAVKLLRNRGYPCAKVTSSANVDDGTLTMNASKLKPFNYGVIEKEKIEGVDERALARFYPFGPNDSFTQLGLDLTEKRFVRTGVVQGTFFQENCDLAKDQFLISQEFIVGPPRTIRFGVGASTELGPIVRIRWTHQRFGSMASAMEARLQSSLKTQTLKLFTEQFWWPDHPRQSMLGELTVERNDQTDFQELGESLKLHLQRNTDTLKRSWTWSTGPSFLLGSYKSGALNETRRYSTLAIEGSIKTQTHIHEFFDDHPEAGDFSRFGFDLRHTSLGFTDPIFKLDYTFLKLFFLGHLGRGNVIGGVRINSGTTLAKSDVNPSTLPPSVKYYGGGSDDVRGFELATLPMNKGAGALTKFSVKLEARKTNFFAPKFEGFTFVDTAWFGDQSLKVTKQMWYSPGGGVRWFSPIGIVQTYLARSLSTQTPRDEGIFFYLGIGGVF